ncbi:hypothetical protein JMJ35_008286 [Cladonia borealis]|uniref:Aminotransferase class I/classII large domain-containing protein n=1 Tax=Cladonia borealis TaxID=184061 RepID=A0AA39QTK0_9LECA|nr:hypothetical protein JMJ35_008286 [Cladonia borealis]
MVLILTPTDSPLSNRGSELSVLGSRFEQFKAIFGNLYDPDTNPGGIVNLGVSENFMMLQEAADFANQNFELGSKDFSYGTGPWGSPRLREAMAKHMNRHFKPFSSIDPKHLLFANGVTALCNMLGFTICDNGHAILLSRPCYQAFKMDFGSEAKVRCEYVAFGDLDQFSPEAVTKYEEALQAAHRNGTNIRALVLCHPHNPLGRCYPRDVLIRYLKLCQKYKIHLLIDEVYAMSVYEVSDPKAVKFESILTIDTDQYIDPDYFHLLYGMSKDTAAGGVRIGCIYTRNKELLSAMSTLSMFHWSGNASEMIATMMLEDEKWMDDFLRLSRERLAHRNKMVRQILDDEGIKYSLRANAGFFIWADFRPFLPPASEANDDPWARETALTKRLLENKVFLTDGQTMSAEEPGWYRVIFSQEERVIKEGLRR